jgi:uncharacterized protein YjdB
MTTDAIAINATPASVMANVAGTGEKTLNYGSNVYNITVTAEDGTQKTYVITINRGQAVTGVSLNKPDTTVAVNATAQLIATVAPDSASNKTVTWSSSNAAVATVSDAGLVTAKSVGTANIVVTTTDGGYTDTCVITVVQPVTGVSLNKTETTLNVNATEQLTATVAPENATNKAVTWSSDNNAVATVSDAGLVTAVSAGTATITVTTQDGGYTKTCVVTVVHPIAVTGVSLNKTATTLNVNTTEQLTATVVPNNATNKAVTWSSSNNEVASVSQTGLITAQHGGIATITVTTEDGNYTAQCEVTVNVPVTGVTLNQNANTLYVGQSEQLIATVLPADATNKNVWWESDNESVATVSSSGEVFAHSPGTAFIFVYSQDGGWPALCEVRVLPVAVTGVSLNKTSATLNVNATEQLSATVAPENATNKAVTWSSSNNAVATVSDNGLVTAVSAGTANITVTTQDGGYTAACAVTVVQSGTGVTGVSLNKTATTLNVNATEQLTATVVPNNATNKAVTWSSSNNAIATVSANGLVTAVSVGTANITVSTQDGGYTAACAVTVVQSGTDITSAFIDLNFRNKVYEAIGKTAPEPILDTDVAGITELYVYSSNIASLEGIQYFTGLQSLYCYDNQLTSLDVSALTNLQKLDCWDNQLTTLDVSALTNLSNFNCGYNQLTTLDVSALANLQYLDCWNNQLTTLDVSALTNLISLI